MCLKAYLIKWLESILDLWSGSVIRARSATPQVISLSYSFYMILVQKLEQIKIKNIKGPYILRFSTQVEIATR